MSGAGGPLAALGQRLFETYGPQHWWPADTPFEVMVGAVLTQNASWKNVEQAIANLKAAQRLTLEDLNALPHAELARLVRPSGFFNVKARRLKNLCAWLQAQGGIEGLAKRETPALRAALLAVNGIGPETADDILLYALERPVFIIDAYTRRLLKTLKLIRGDEDYETLRRRFESSLPAKPALFNEYHALIVRHAKEKCAAPGPCRHCAVEKAPLEQTLSPPA